MPPVEEVPHFLLDFLQGIVCWRKPHISNLPVDNAVYPGGIALV